MIQVQLLAQSVVISADGESTSEFARHHAAGLEWPESALAGRSLTVEVGRSGSLIGGSVPVNCTREELEAFLDYVFEQVAECTTPSVRGSSTRPRRRTWVVRRRPGHERAPRPGSAVGVRVAPSPSAEPSASRPRGRCGLWVWGCRRRPRRRPRSRPRPPAPARARPRARVETL